MKKLNFGTKFEIKEGYDNYSYDKNSKYCKFSFNSFPYPIKDNTYDYIYSNETLEHLNEPEKVLKELHRISKKEAIIKIIVPYYNNKGAYSNMQHQHYFSDTSFIIFIKENPNIFEIKSLKLIPSSIGKFLPRFIRNKLSLFISGLIALVDVELRVLK